MGDREPSLDESGFLTGDPNSHQPTPSGTFETLYDSVEQLKNLWEPSRKRLHSSSVCDLDDEPQLSHHSQIHYPSAPNIPESYRRRNDQNQREVNEAETERDTPRERQIFLDNSGEAGGNEEKKKKSYCERSVKISLWLIVCCFVFVLFIIAILLGCLLSLGVVKDLSSCKPPCEESWIWAGGRCYYFSDALKTWNDSLEFCTTHGSTLAMLIDSEIQKTIERYRDKVDYWIGLSMNDDGQWMWTNGSLHNGSVDNQSNRHLRCAFLNSHLRALDCTTRRQWICVKDSARFQIGSPEVVMSYLGLYEYVRTRIAHLYPEPRRR